MDEHDVNLYVYDISRGLARSLGSFFLDGKQIDGVWHTGVVVYGREYFFGGGGINYCKPNGTILGQPTSVINLGKTQVPLDMFEEYLQQLSASTFRADCYHLLDHNCNTFSNEIALFLTGNGIPSNITGLTQEILNTSLGAMLRPFIDSMSMRTNPMFNNFISGSNSSPSSSLAHPDQGNQSTKTKIEAKREDLSISPQLDAPNICTFLETMDLGSYKQRLASMNICPSDSSLMEEVLEYLSTVECNWSLTRQHMNALCKLITDEKSSCDTRSFAGHLLVVLLARTDVVVVCKHDPSRNFFVILESHETLGSDLSNLLAKSACNFISTDTGVECIFNGSSDGELLVKLCQFCLLNENDEMCLVGCQMASNILRRDQVSPDLALVLGISLAELCCRENTRTRDLDHLWFGLYRCVKINNQLADVAKTMGLDVSKHENKYVKLLRPFLE